MGRLGLGCRVGKTIIGGMVVTVLEKSRLRLPKGALSFVSDRSFTLQLTVLATGMAMAGLVANAARHAFTALVAAYQNSAPGDWLTSTALVTTLWVLAFAGSALIFKWGPVAGVGNGDPPACPTPKISIRSRFRTWAAESDPPRFLTCRHPTGGGFNRHPCSFRTGWPAAPRSS